jgi:hypothetical protein
MDRLFPLGFPGPTAFYLTLYVLTFALSQALMHYVLAGSLYLAWATTWRGKASVTREKQPLAATLRDWMPFLLGAAITAGVAPLLFIQIVYQRQFYTANLLLWWRWMLVVPVLIVAFYLLYLIKSTIMIKWPQLARAAVGFGTASCFVFVGFCWTANHLLGNSVVNWPEVYVTGQLPFDAWTVVPRMLIWMGGSFTTMAVIVGWQLRYQERRQTGNVLGNSTRPLAALSLGGLGVAVTAATVSVLQTDGPTRQMLFGNLALPYVLLTVLGVAVQATAWIIHWRSERLIDGWLAAASVGAAFSLLGVSVIREVARIRDVDFTSLFPRHAEAAAISGFSVFLISAVIVLLLMAWCVRLVRRGLVTATVHEHRGSTRKGAV